MTEFCMFMPFQGITSVNSWLGGIKVIWKIKVMGMKKKKWTLERFISTMDKMDKDGGNKTQRLYRCGSIYALSKPIVNNGLEDLI